LQAWCPGSFLPVALNSHLRLFIAIGFSLAFNTPGRAQLDYRGGLLRQDFNSLPREADPNLSDLLQANAKGPVDLAASPPFEPGCSGWSIYARAGSLLSLKVGNGSLGTPAAYSFGQTSSMDRALGSLAGGAMAANFGLRLKNSTGRSISSFTLVYTQEQWRNGGTALPNGLTLEYRITATSEGIESGKAFANIDGTTATSNSSSSSTAQASGARVGETSKLRVVEELAEGVGGQPQALAEGGEGRGPCNCMTRMTGHLCAETCAPTWCAQFMAGAAATVLSQAAAGQGPALASVPALRGAVCRRAVRGPSAEAQGRDQG